MRSRVSTVSATLLLAGLGVTGLASAALAGADDGGSKAFWSQSSAPAAQTSPDGTRYTATYGARDTRTDAAAAASAKEPTPWYFNHAQGSMGN